jgi:hypothetical protein
MKKFLASIAAAACFAGAANAQQAAGLSNPRGMVDNFDVDSLGPLLTELGAVWQRQQAPDGQSFIAVAVGGDLILHIIPTACQGQNHTNCIGMNMLALFSGSSFNYQTVAAFNQKYWFSTAGITSDGSAAYLSRYEIADYGIPRGNIMASILNFDALADLFRQELATSARTVSLEGHADDLSARLLNSRGLEAFAGADALDLATKHQMAMEESAEFVKVLLETESTPHNKIENITVKK